MIRGSKQEVVCKCGCGVKFMARTADIKRGWGKFATKSCKAKHQEKRTGQHTKYLMNRKYKDSRSLHDIIEDSFHPHDSYSLGQE